MYVCVWWRDRGGKEEIVEGLNTSGRVELPQFQQLNAKYSGRLARTLHSRKSLHRGIFHAARSFRQSYCRRSKGVEMRDRVAERGTIFLVIYFFLFLLLSTACLA